MMTSQASKSTQILDLNNPVQDLSAFQPKVHKLDVDKLLAMEVKPNQKLSLSFNQMASSSNLANLPQINVTNAGNRPVPLELLLGKSFVNALRSQLEAA